MDNDVVKFRIGKWNATLFRDFMFKYLAKDYFINAEQEQLNQSLNQYRLNPDSILSPFIALLLQHEDKNILIDTGIGHTEEPLIFRGNSFDFKGRLQQLLKNENIRKEDITDVIITHFHPDHIGGMVNGMGELNFPNAQFHMHEDEWNFWHSSGSDQQPPIFRHLVEKNITLLKDRDPEFVKGEEQEILPGITAIKIPGHTPGQLALRIFSQNDRLLYISDAFLHPLHMEQLNWKTNYDLDHEQARNSRKQMLELAYKEDMEIMAFHFDFPGLGRVDKTGSGWKWVHNKS